MDVTRVLILAGAGSAVASIASVASYPVLLALGGAAGAAVRQPAPASTPGAVVPVLIGGAPLVLIIRPLIGGLAPLPGAERSRAAGPACSPSRLTWGISAPRAG